jgi:hypothetical protein
MIELPGGHNIFYFVVFSSKTSFMKLQDVFPECFLHRDTSPRIEPVVCLAEDNICHVGHNCMEILCKRVHVLFNEILSGVQILVLYYKKRNLNGLGAAIFWKNGNREPRIITMNPYAWNRIKQRGSVFQFTANSEFYLTGTSSKPEETDKSAIS